MSDTKKCKVCSKEVPKSTKKCPYCGAKLKMGIIKKILLSILAIFILLYIIGTILPNDSNNTNLANKSSIKKSTTASNTDTKNSTNDTSTKPASKNSSGFDFTKEENKLSDSTIQSLYKKKMNYVDLKSKWFSADYYKLTMDQSKYIYYGDLKDNEPDGIGILLQRVDSIVYLYVPIYIGNFKNGNFNGFGYKYKQACESDIVTTVFSDFTDQFKNIGAVYKSYEGYFKDGNFTGNGNAYEIDFGSDLYDFSTKSIQNVTSNTTFDKYITDNKTEIDKLEDAASNRSSDSDYIVSKLPPLNSLLYYSGEFSKDKFNGKGKIYGKNNAIIYDGNFSNSQYDGNGKLYFKTGKLQYDGDFSKGKYDGKGTLYNEDGSIKYSGEWSNGDIK